MLHNEIKLGDILWMKVSGAVVPVTVESIRPRYKVVADGGYETPHSYTYHCTNNRTGRKCTAHSASKFRGRVAR